LWVPWTLYCLVTLYDILHLSCCRVNVLSTINDIAFSLLLFSSALTFLCEGDAQGQNLPSALFYIRPAKGGKFQKFSSSYGYEFWRVGEDVWTLNVMLQIHVRWTFPLVLLGERADCVDPKRLQLKLAQKCSELY
jgi:hypothetical protein